MGKVFISHATEDRDTAHRVAEYLEREGIEVWIAPRDVPPGSDYGASILGGIEGCSALVLVLSEHSNASPYVQKEVERAVAKGRPVLPLRIREVTPSGSLEFFVSSAQWIDAWRAPIESHLTRLAAALRAIEGGEGAEPTRAPLPVRPARGRLAIALALVAAAAIASGLCVWAPWLPAWQRAGVDFLAGSWCMPMSGDASMRMEFVKAGPDLLAGEARFTHSTQVDRFRARVALWAEGFELTWLAPEGGASGRTERLRVQDEVSLRWLGPGGEPDNRAPMTRCPPGGGR